MWDDYRSSILTWLFDSHNPFLVFVCQLIYPVINYQAKTKKVWALPGSLATTAGIVVYFLFLSLLRCFSSGAYLYISYVFRYEWLDMTLAGFPHLDIRGSQFIWQLPAAYRSLSRPSSVSYVKASVMCAYVTFYALISLTSYWCLPIAVLPFVIFWYIHIL